VKLGIHFGHFDLPGGAPALAGTVANVARAAEEGGCAIFTLMDHWFQMDRVAPAEEPMLEGYTTLGFLAAHTQRIKLGLLVTGVTYRHPGLVAKILTTLDVLSDGRAQLGIGAAWYEREHRGLGVPFPPIAERFERLEEAIQICNQMWSDDDGPYHGRHYQLAETICSPRPLQIPRPQILIGGGGERKTLRLVAQYADACNLLAVSPEVVAHKLEVLERHCDAVGRDPATIQKTILTVDSDPLAEGDEFISRMEQYARMGVELVELVPRGEDPVAVITQIGERVVPRLADLGPL
jgi:F420-dependent oxidoreductase-like protein